MAGQVISRLASSGGSDAGVHVISSSFYGTCSSAANAENKEVIIQNRNINNIKLVKGMLLTVKFAYGNSVTSELPTLQIFANAANSDSATPVKGTNLTTNILKIFAKANDTMQPEGEPNSVVSFVYDTYYDQTNNETYGCGIKTEASDTVLATKLEQVELTVSQVESATTSLSTGLGNLTNRVDEIGQVAVGAILDADMQYISGPIGTTPSQTPTAGENQWQTIAPEYEYGYYIWQRMATVTAGSVTPSYSDPVCISGRDGADGQPGAAGASAYQYYLSASPSALINNNGTISPASVVFSVSRAQGTELPQDCPAYFVIAEYNNNGGSTKYSGNNNGQNSKSYSPSTTAATLIQCTIYDATNTSVQLDSQTVHIVKNGKDGQNGTSVTVDSIQYGVSENETTSPQSGNVTVPTVTPGGGLGTKTSYVGVATPAISKSYIGTDGQDGISVTVQSINKTDGTTTVILDKGDGTTAALVIEDGTDGENGLQGPAGENGEDGISSYIHVAGANAIGTTTPEFIDFSRTNTGNLNYLYMGTYTDTASINDSENPLDYSGTLIKGEDGEDSYYVYLTNENHTFAATASAAITATVSSEVIAYKGITPTNVTFSSSLNTNPIEGITVTSHNSTSTANAYFTVSVTPGLTTNNKYGVIHIPVIVDGQEFVKDFSGTLAPAGTAGTNAYNRQTVFLYKRSTTTPTAGPSGPLNYTFSTGTITPSSNLNGGSSSFPDGTDPCWVIAGTAAAEASVASDAIETNGWSSPTLYVQNGINGTNGIDAYSQATISLYQRSVSTPAEPTDPLYYTFSTGTLTPANSLGSGTRGITAATNGEPCGIISANAISDGATYTISDGSDPVIFTVDGIDGNDGAQILGIITAPTTYTTQQGDFTPAYRISLATVKTQSGASEVKVGDILAYSYYHYPVGYVDSNYVYCGARKSIRGATGAAAYTYNLTCNPAAIVLDTNTTPVTFNPTSVTLAATRAQGTGNPAAYSGRFELEYYDGSTGSGVVASTANESSKNCSIANVTTTATLLRATLYMADDTTTAVDTQTIPILRDGTNGTNGADAYTVILDNENHTFAAENGAAVTATVTSQIYAYKGTTLTSATIGNITGTATGMTISKTGSSTAAKFTVSVTPGLITSQGTLTIPVTVDEKSFTKKFTGALAKNGLNQATINLYKRATSASKPTSGTATYTFSTKTLTNTPSGGSTTFPQETQGSTTPVGIMSAIASSSTDTDTIEYGEGSTPIKMVSSGSNGDDGYNQASINIYKQSTNQPGNNDLPTEILTHTFSSGANSFGGTTPAVSNGGSTIIPDASTTPTWMRSAIAISTAATDTITTTEGSDPAIKYAELPKSISSIVEYYQRTNSTTAPQKRSADGGSGTGDNGGGTTISQVDATHKYLGNYEVINYNDNSSDSTAPRIVGTYAKDGTSITITGIEYGQSANVSTEPSTGYNETDGASQSIGTGVGIGVKTTYSNNSTSINKSYVGTNGINGQPGTSSYTHIAGANSSNGQTDFSKTSSTNKTYLGICINNTQSDSSLTYDKYTGSLIQGKSIVSIINKYKTTINAIRPATSDNDGIIPNPPNVNIPTVDSTNKYLGTYEETTYQNPSTTETTQPHLIGAYGDTGVSPTSFVEQEILWQYDDSDLNTHPAPGDNDTGTDGDVVGESGKYIGGRTKIIWSDSTEQNPHITYTDPILASGTNALNERMRLTDTGSGIIITSNDAANLSPLSLTVHGKSVQDGTPTPSAPVEIRSVEGRNLSPYFSHDITDVYSASTNPNGYWFWFSTEATYTQKDDGWVHIAYSNTGSSAVYPNCIVQHVPDLKNGASYTFMVEIANATISGDVKFSPNGSAGSTVAYLNNVTAFSIANNSTYYKSTTAKSDFSGCNRFTRSYFNVPAGGSISLDLRISIYEGGYAGAYQPYQSITAAITGKNLLDASIVPSSYAQVSYTNGSDGSIVLNGTKYGGGYYVVKTGLGLLLEGTYTLHATLISGTATNRPTIYLMDSDGNVLVSATPTSGSIEKVTFTTDAVMAERIRFGLFTDNAVYTNATYRIWLTAGSELTEYEQFVGSTVFIDLDGNSLRSIPNGTEDTLVIDGEGNKTLTKRMGSITLDGSSDETWTRNTSYSGFMLTDNTMNVSGKPSEQLLCNMFVGASARGNGVTGTNIIKTYSSASDNHFLFFCPSNFSDYADVAAWKTWLASNPITLVYPLATPQTISLGKIDLPSLPSPSFSMYVDAAVTPTLDAEGGTTLGYETGKQHTAANSLLAALSNEITKTQEALTDNAVIETNQGGFITDKKEKPNKPDEQLINNTGDYDNGVTKVSDSYIIIKPNETNNRYEITKDTSNNYIIKDKIIQNTAGQNRDVTDFCIIKKQDNNDEYIYKYYPYNYYCYEYKFLNGEVTYSEVIYDSVKSSIAENKIAEEYQQKALEKLLNDQTQVFYSDDNGAHVKETTGSNYETTGNTTGIIFSQGDAKLLDILAISGENGKYSGMNIYNGKTGRDEQKIAQFIPNLIQLGSDAEDRVRITREKIEFIKENKSAAEIGNDGFYTPNITVDSKLSLKTPAESINSENQNETYEGAGIPRSNGNIAFKGIGTPDPSL